MGKNLKMGPRADEKFDKRNLEWTKIIRKWDPKNIVALSSSLKGDPQVSDREASRSILQWDSV